MQPRIFAASLLIGLLTGTPAAHAAKPHDWATGVELQQSLAKEVNVVWGESPLADSLENLSRAHRVAILLDRRIDPSQKPGVSLKEVTLQSAFEAIAKQCRMEAAQLGAVMYFGPPGTASRLRGVAAMLKQEVRRLPASLQRKYLKQQPMAWDNLASPRELLDQLANQNGLTIANPEKMPHDLWRAADLPAMSLVDRLTLVAIQFDLCFTVSAGGTQLELASLPERVPQVPPEPRVAAPRTEPKRPAAAPEKPIQRFTVRDQPLGPVLKKVAAQLSLELRVDNQAIEAAGISLDQRVSAQVESATVDELFEALLKSTGLKFRHHENVIEIVPAG